MTKLVLALHVLAAIIAVGPVTVAASMFPAAARRAASSPGDEVFAGVRILNRICRVYAEVGLAVPVFGFATASLMHVLNSPWLITSIILTAVAALLLGQLVLPRQHALLTALVESTAEPRLDRAATARLAMLTGCFNLLWATVTVLMIVRPGSATGA
ncbi:DUF2269 family protein [Streptomyces malaysiense]|uniref:DUF2269 family protein n=1 Tax=Streptomyces malaysiense TaxID=1428626 RepID=A0A1J4PQ87_9ACTN|nr:DUF2269 family protein [Streptomyces malaysiense]OIK23083.1 hypothetical protein VT52_034490 [Streptomyces malaysiense]